MANKLKINFTYPKKLEPLFTTEYMFNVVYGGRGSGKTDTIGQVAIAHSFLGSGKLLITRFIQNSLDKSTKSTIEKWINRLNLKKFFQINKTSIKNLYSGSEFIFLGLSKKTMENIASIDNVFFAWIDEGHTIPKEAWQRFYPSIRGAYDNGSFAKIFISFNPHYSTDTFWEFFIKNNKRQDTLLIEINYNDNPFFKDSPLSQQLKNDLKFMPNSYNEHIWGGKLKYFNDEPIIDYRKFGRFDFSKIKEYNYDSVVLSLDTAYSLKESADFSVIGVFAYKKDIEEIHVLRILRGRWEFSELKNNLKYMYNWTAQEIKNPDCILIENKASGQSLIQELEKYTTLPIQKITPTKDKYSRVCEVLEILHSGRFKIPLESDALHLWIKSFLMEMIMFRADLKHDHDDMVDVTTQAINFFVNKNINYDTLLNIFENLGGF